MSKTSKGSKSMKNNTKTKASGGKDIHKPADVKNAIKTNLNKRTKKPRTVSNKPKKNTASGTSKGGNNAQSNIRATKLTYIKVDVNCQRSKKAMEESKQHNKNYGYTSRGLSGRAVVRCIGVNKISKKFERFMEKANNKVNDQDDSTSKAVE